MRYSKQNFFHPDHPVAGSDLRDGLDEKKYYSLKREGLGRLKVDYHDVIGAPDAPVAIILHGYRGQPNGPNNLVCTNILRSRGFATAQIGFAGYDHYGRREMLQKSDLATLSSNIEDVRIVMNAIPSHRKIILVANCGSISIAPPAADARTTHIFALSPVPNILAVIRAHLKKNKLKIGDEDFVMSPDNPRWKFSRAFMEAGQPVDLCRRQDLLALSHKPRILTVRSSDSDAGRLVRKWLDASQVAGYRVEDMAFRGDAHAPTSEMWEGIKQQIELIESDLDALRSAIDPHHLTLVPQS